MYRRLARANPQAFEPDLAMSLTNLARSLAALGRREEALEAAQEAVEVYRRLARANPQAFEPELARSLGTLGMVLLGSDRAREAAEAFSEGVRRLLPHARALPQAFGPLLKTLVQDYLRACQAAGLTPDADLMQEVASILEPRVSPALVHLIPLLLAVAAVARGEGDQGLASQVRETLGQLQQAREWQALATALLRLLEGERDPQARTAGLNLDEVDTQALALTLAAVTSDEGLQALAALAALVREAGQDSR